MPWLLQLQVTAISLVLLPMALNSRRILSQLHALIPSLCHARHSTALHPHLEPLPLPLIVRTVLRLDQLTVMSMVETMVGVLFLALMGGMETMTTTTIL